MTTYADELNAAWAAHLEPRQEGARTVVSLFAGCGGSSLGYSMAGYRELLAVEWDDHAAATFRLNFPNVKVHHGDIAEVDPAVIGLERGQLDVLDGSPPCQGFSTAGARNLADSRNDLFLQFVRLLVAWQPKAFVMENVSGMIKGKMRLKFVEILAALKQSGYRVEVRLVDASQLGVPQRRQRLVFVGIRNDFTLTPAYPMPRSGPPVTVRDAWRDIGDIGEPPSIAMDTKSSKIIPLIPPGSNGGKALKALGCKASFFNTFRLHWDSPACTITKSWSRCGSPALIHPSENRFPGRRELTRLQSFPDNFEWPGGTTYKQLYARLGNSVPPLMMREIAKTISATLAKSDSQV
jgi:DNA (cytosine-5)-methyltransferase 1